MHCFFKPVVCYQNSCFLSKLLVRQSVYTALSMAEMTKSRLAGESVIDTPEFTFRNVQLLKNETLGTGSYGAVCKAKCDQLICAVKLLYPVLFRIQAPDPGKDRRHPFCRFEQECQFLSCINHPNIVQYLGTYHDPDTNAPVLLMELMDESLTQLLESSSEDISYHVQVNLSQDIAQALAFLHDNGIIHRDLSSNNVLLIAGSRAKVSDFGMSKLANMDKESLATLTQCPGTPAFMSPEALDKPPVYTEKLDNFSFGVILVQILTRQFPAPTDRFATEEIPDRRNPTRKIKAKVPIPEVERRQAHIKLIEPTHPLLPIALECLKDEAEERPSSQQLCHSLDTLKGTAKYKDSMHDVKHYKEEIREKDQQIRTADEKLQALQCEVETMEKQLQAKDQLTAEVVSKKAEQLEALRLEIKTMKRQLRSLNEQVESGKETTAALKHTIAERDSKLALLNEMIASQPKGGHTAQATPNVKEQVSMSWELLPVTHLSFAKLVSAVVRNKAYFVSGSSIWEFTHTCNQWIQLLEPPACRFSLVSVENELTIVGGYVENLLGKYKDSNKLYSYTDEKWVEKYPPMPTKRYACTAVYISHALIVVGGLSDGADGEDTELTTVEILSILSKQWSSVSSLPYPVSWPSVSIGGGHIYVHDTFVPSEEHSVLRCSLLSLSMSAPTSVATAVIWERIASLPVRGSTLVSVGDHLLAVGGSAVGDTKFIRQYNPNTDSWQIVSQMQVARFECAVALLPNNKLLVMGGASEKEPFELATILL